MNDHRFIELFSRIIARTKAARNYLSIEEKFVCISSSSFCRPSIDLPTFSPDKLAKNEGNGGNNEGTSFAANYSGLIIQHKGVETFDRNHSRSEKSRWLLVNDRSIEGETSGGSIKKEGWKIAIFHLIDHEAYNHRSTMRISSPSIPPLPIVRSFFLLEEKNF